MTNGSNATPFNTLFNTIGSTAATMDNTQSKIIVEMFNSEVTFSLDALKSIFTADKVEPRVSAILSQINDEYANDLKVIELIKDETGRLTQDQIRKREDAERRCVAKRTQFKRAASAVVFLRDATNDALGSKQVLTAPVARVVLKNNRITLTVREGSELVRIDTGFSGRELTSRGDKIISVWKGKPVTAATKATETVDPVSTLSQAAKATVDMFDIALAKQAEAMRAGGTDVKTANIDDLTGDLPVRLETIALRVLRSKFEHGGHMDAADLLEWLRECGVKVVDAKPVRKSA